MKDMSTGIEEGMGECIVRRMRLHNNNTMEIWEGMGEARTMGKGFTRSVNVRNDPLHRGDTHT